MSAVPVERCGQICGDVLRRPPLDVLALEHEHELSVLEESHLRGRGRVVGEVGAGARGRIGVLAGKHRQQPLGPLRMLQGERGGGTRVARRAAAYRVHHDERGFSGRAEHCVYVLRRAQLLEAQASELLAHRLHEAGVVQRDVEAGHGSIIARPRVSANLPLVTRCAAAASPGAPSQPLPYRRTPSGTLSCSRAARTRQRGGECGSTVTSSRLNSSRSFSRQVCAKPRKNRCSGVNPSMRDGRGRPARDRSNAAYAMRNPFRSARFSPSVSWPFTCSVSTATKPANWFATSCACVWNRSASCLVHQSRRLPAASYWRPWSSKPWVSS